MKKYRILERYGNMAEIGSFMCVFLNLKSYITFL